MARFTICATLTENTQGRLKNWIAAVAAAARGFDAEVVIAHPADLNIENVGAMVPQSLPASLAAAASGSTADLATAMLQSASQRKSEILVFADMEAVLQPDCLSHYETALGAADFAYADIRYMSSDNAESTETLFTGAAVADRIQRIEQLIDRNWLSFANTAMRRESLPGAAKNIPADVSAPAWWFFSSLVRAGTKGVLAAGIAAHLHDGDGETARPGGVTDAALFIKRCEAVLDHYQSFADVDDLMRDRAVFLRGLIEKIESDPEGVAPTLAKAAADAKLWHEDVGLLLTLAGPVGGAVAPLQLLKYSKPERFATRSSLVEELKGLGVDEGDTLMPHISLKSVGYVIGGGRTLLDALYDAVGDTGTIVMPAFSGELTDPATWFKPPVPREWQPIIREEMPAYDPETTPSTYIGATAELFRNEPGTLRSAHPVSSFTARGPLAADIVGEHPLDCRFGAKSPLGKLRDYDGKTLLIGAPFEHMTILHLTTYELDIGDRVDQKSPILVNGCKEWVSYEDLSITGYWFEDAVNHLIDLGVAELGTLHDARTLMVSVRDAVDATISWRKKHKV